MMGFVRTRARGNLLHLHPSPPKSPKQIPGATGENWVWLRCTLLILPKPVTRLAQGWTCIKLHNLFALSAFQTMAKALTDVFQQVFFSCSAVSNKSPSASQENLPVKNFELTFQIHFFLCQVCRKRLKQLIGDFQEIHIFYSSVGKTWDFLTMPRDRYITALHCTAVIYKT